MRSPGSMGEQRVAVYRRLFFKNIAGFIGRAFPVLRKLYSDQHWQQLVREFYGRHHCRTPYFRRIPKEFVDYLSKEHVRRPHDPPFLAALAYYEWIELSLLIAKEPDQVTKLDKEGDLFTGRPVLTPLVRSYSSDWPLHQIKPGFQPRQASPQAHHYVVYRDLKERVRFLHINQTSSLLIDSIKQHPQYTGCRHVEETLRQSGLDRRPSGRETLIEEGRALLKQLREKEVLLGTWLED